MPLSLERCVELRQYAWPQEIKDDHAFAYYTNGRAIYLMTKAEMELTVDCGRLELVAACPGFAQLVTAVIREVRSQDMYLEISVDWKTVPYEGMEFDVEFRVTTEPEDDVTVRCDSDDPDENMAAAWLQLVREKVGKA